MALINIHLNFNGNARRFTLQIGFGGICQSQHTKTWRVQIFLLIKKENKLCTLLYQLATTF